MSAIPAVTPPSDALRALWLDAGLPPAALADASFDGPPVLPSSFAVDTAAQASIGAAALAAVEIRRARTGLGQSVRVGTREAAAECSAFLSIDGRVPEAWDPMSGLYPCGADLGAPGHVRIHANFAHHRRGALALLGLQDGPALGKADVAHALRRWRAQDFEQAAADAGMVVSALRSFDEWDDHAQAEALRGEPLIGITRIGDAPATPWTAQTADAAPLAGVRVLDLTRILAGPVAGRTLAAHGADVMLVNSPMLPNIEAIAATSLGKRSVLVDLDGAGGIDTLATLVRGADVFMQGYRPGGLAARGFGPQALASLRPGIVCVSLCAYGFSGPWSGRRGFDSLVQTATGFNHAEGAAAGALAEPRALPVQILDYAAGFLMAFGAQVALLRRAQEGGSWQVQVSLARTGLWLRSLGRDPSRLVLPKPDLSGLMAGFDTGYGRLVTAPHAAALSQTPARWARPSRPPGSDAPHWEDGAGA
jgi:crotonobetainyl-CoA:carnitine CoA-transferase CaiB-like acyl-CoA transferase